MKTAFVITVVLLLGGYAYVEFGAATHRDGSYDLMVVIEQPATSISYMGVHSSEQAERVLNNLDRHVAQMPKASRKDAFQVEVGFSYRDSPLSRRWGQTQEYSHLIVVLHQTNSSRSVHKVAVPHRNFGRRVVVGDSNCVFLGKHEDVYATARN